MADEGELKLWRDFCDALGSPDVVQQGRDARAAGKRRWHNPFARCPGSTEEGADYHEQWDDGWAMEDALLVNPPQEAQP